MNMQPEPYAHARSAVSAFGNYLRQIMSEESADRLGEDEHELRAYYQAWTATVGTIDPYMRDVYWQEVRDAMLVPGVSGGDVVAKADLAALIDTLSEAADAGNGRRDDSRTSQISSHQPDVA